MLYCADCQSLCAGGKRCPFCGSGRLRPVRPGDPVLLCSASQEEEGPIAGALGDAGIPYLEKTEAAGGVTSIVLGRSRSAGVRVFVPYGERERGRDVLRGIGFLKDDPPARTAGEEAEEKRTDEKSGGAPAGGKGRKAARIFSILLFLLAVAAVAILTDALIDRLRFFFHW